MSRNYFLRFISKAGKSFIHVFKIIQTIQNSSKIIACLLGACSVLGDGTIAKNETNLTYILMTHPKSSKRNTKL
jgi:hypothetical protein